MLQLKLHTIFKTSECGTGIIFSNSFFFTSDSVLIRSVDSLLIHYWRTLSVAIRFRCSFGFTGLSLLISSLSVSSLLSSGLAARAKPGKMFGTHGKAPYSTLPARKEEGRGRGGERGGGGRGGEGRRGRRTGEEGGEEGRAGRRAGEGRSAGEEGRGGAGGEGRGGEGRGEGRGGEGKGRGGEGRGGEGEGRGGEGRGGAGSSLSRIKSESKVNLK